MIHDVCGCPTDGEFIYHMKPCPTLAKPRRDWRVGLAPYARVVLIWASGFVAGGGMAYLLLRT